MPEARLWTLRRAAPVLLEQLVTELVQQELRYGLLYGVGRGGCQMARVVDGRLETRGAGPRRTFEARVFASDRELRWVADADRVGKGPMEGMAVLLVDSVEAPSCPEGWERSRTPLEPLEVEPGVNAVGRYLLWGTSRVCEQGWSQLFEEQVGRLWVPVELPVGSMAGLRYREYVDTIDDHGNVAVVAERLSALEAVEVTDG